MPVRWHIYQATGFNEHQSMTESSDLTERALFPSHDLHVLTWPGRP